MRRWKTVVVVVVVVLLVKGGVALVRYAVQTGAQRTEIEAVRTAKNTIKTLRIIAEKESLTRQILEDRIATAKLQAQFAPTSAPPPATPE